MTLTLQTLVVSYAAPVTGGEFSVPFAYWADDGLLVRFKLADESFGDALTADQDYSLAPDELSYGGGTLTLLAAVPAGATDLVIDRQTVPAQEASFDTAEAKFEAALDRGFMVLQEHRVRIVDVEQRVVELSQAVNIEYDNAASGLDADNLQEAIDALDAIVDDIVLGGDGGGTAPSIAAIDVSYSNADSTLAAANVKAALDELDTAIGAVTTPAAVDVSYSNADSTLAATNVKAALDELDAAVAAVASAAGDVAFDNTGLDIAGDGSAIADVQAALAAVDTRLDALEAEAPLVHVRDEKPSGTDGQAIAFGSWITRDLNAVLTNEIDGVSISANQIVGLPAGIYWCEAEVPGFAIERNQARLYNATDAAAILTGSNEQANTSGSGDESSGESSVIGRFTLTDPKTVEIQHRTTSSGNGGEAAGWGTEIYTDVRIWRIGDAP